MTTPAIILGLLSVPLLPVTTLNRATTGRQSGHKRLAGCIGITLVFCFTGVGHFVKTEPMAEMLPPWVPGGIPLVYLTGVIGIAAAITVLIRIPLQAILVAWIWCFAMRQDAVEPIL